ncbi:metallophosphoesterase family protein [Paucibacter sp. Y2R2-4]|uniref:metallophosphoesterase family protein n=1 Tax=Paucibacter sp. Y2R2-4 TaxID=2893553 RepID=UPI00398CAF61
MAERRIRIALLSDLHAFQKGHGSAMGSSYLPASPRPSDPDPFGDLDQLISREKLTCDLVMCPGDICDKADVGGFQYAWTKLHALKEALAARQLIATCGNHDLNSRLLESDEDPDPKGALQTVHPQFPFEDTELTDHFWSRNFALFKPMDGIVTLVLNTSAYHGGNSDEIHHGRISQRTISAIEKKLESFGDGNINILLCHHHLRPLQGLWGKAPDGEYIRKGPELLKTLTKCTASPWLILHGHRHIPNLEHSYDPSCIIVGASSFSAQVQGKHNQFHILDLTQDESRAQPVKGVIDTWSWSVTGGWQRRHIGQGEDGFPPECGFGSDSHPRLMANEISKSFEGDPKYLDWSAVISQNPEVRFLTPEHFSQVEDLLLKRGISLNRSRDGRVSQVGKSK